MTISLVLTIVCPKLLKALCDESSEKVVWAFRGEREHFKLQGIREGCLEEVTFAVGIEG